MLIGELYLPIEQFVLYYGKDGKGAHLPFNFQLISTAWAATAIAALVEEYEAALPPGAWPNWVLGNHDQKRIAARLGPDPGAHRGDAPAYASRHTDDLLWR